MILRFSSNFEYLRSLTRGSSLNCLSINFWRTMKISRCLEVDQLMRFICSNSNEYKCGLYNERNQFKFIKSQQSPSKMFVANASKSVRLFIVQKRSSMVDMGNNNQQIIAQSNIHHKIIVQLAIYSYFLFLIFRVCPDSWRNLM